MSDIIFKGAFGKVNGKYNHSRNSDAPAVLIVGNIKEKNNKKKGSDFEELANIMFDIFINNDFSVLKFDLKEYDVKVFAGDKVWIGVQMEPFGVITRYNGIFSIN